MTDGDIYIPWPSLCACIVRSTLACLWSEWGPIFPSFSDGDVGLNALGCPQMSGWRIRASLAQCHTDVLHTRLVRCVVSITGQQMAHTARNGSALWVLCCMIHAVAFRRLLVRWCCTTHARSSDHVSTEMPCAQPGCPSRSFCGSDGVELPSLVWWSSSAVSIFVAPQGVLSQSVR